MKNTLKRNGIVVGLFNIDTEITVRVEDDMGEIHMATFDTVVAFETWADYHGLEVC